MTALAMALVLGILLGIGRRQKRTALPELADWRGFFCAECGREFDSQRTLVLHCNATHPDTYDDEREIS